MNSLTGLGFRAKGLDAIYADHIPLLGGFRNSQSVAVRLHEAISPS